MSDFLKIKKMTRDCVIPPAMSIEAQGEYSLSSPDHHARDITEYVEGQARDEKVSHCELMKSEFVSGTGYDVWDVHANKGRWWVITNMTNLYQQADFPSLDYTLSFHIGLMARIAAKQSRIPDAETAEITAIFRKLEQVSESLREGDEVESFQSIGLQCREVLISLSRALASVATLVDNPSPKAADFKNWASLAADSLSSGGSAKESRAFLKAIASRGWDLVCWLTHSSNATYFDCINAVMATNACVDAYAMMLRNSAAATLIAVRDVIHIK